MRYTYTESVGESYITHEFEDLTLSEWLVVQKELSPNKGVLVTNGGDYKDSSVDAPKNLLPLTKEDLEKGGWFLKDTSLEAKKAFENLGMKTSHYSWGTSGYACDLSGGMVFSNSLSDWLEEDSTTEVVLIDGQFYKKDIV
jgi:hypothetical protein